MPDPFDVPPDAVFKAPWVSLCGEFDSFMDVEAVMLERERQVFNLLRDGKWICFLVGEITDQIAQGLHSEPIFDTDLCKRILNAFLIDRRRRYRLEIPLELKVRDEEFEPYMRHYGRPTTVFELPQDLPTERHAIAWLGNGVVGQFLAPTVVSITGFDTANTFGSNGPSSTIGDHSDDDRIAGTLIAGFLGNLLGPVVLLVAMQSGTYILAGVLVLWLLAGLRLSLAEPQVETAAEV